MNTDRFTASIILRQQRQTSLKSICTVTCPGAWVRKHSILGSCTWTPTSQAATLSAAFQCSGSADSIFTFSSTCNSTQRRRSRRLDTSSDTDTTVELAEDARPGHLIVDMAFHEKSMSKKDHFKTKRVSNTFSSL